MESLTKNLDQTTQKIKEIQTRQQKAPKYFTKPLLKEKCEICDNTTLLQRHHITYEPPEVITVCHNCHCLIHQRKIGKITTNRERQKSNRKKVNHKYYESHKKPHHIENKRELLEPKKFRRSITNHKYYLKRKEVIKCQPGTQ